MLLAVILAALVAPQEEVIPRTDPARAQYQEAVNLCRAALELLDRDPGAAAAKLTELLDRHGQLPKIECRLRIIVFADDPGSAFAFYPYQARGRARLAMAASPKLTPGERADDVESAVHDFERSVERGASSSKPFLQDARRQWWSSLQPLLVRDAALPARAAIRARTLLRDQAGDGLEREVKDALSWFSSQLGPVEAKIRSYARTNPGDRRRAQEDAAWCRACEQALETVPGAAEMLARFRTAGLQAAGIATYRGAFRLKISASPWAEVTRLVREGIEIPLPIRETPLVIPGELEIGDFEIELSHPRLGRRTRRILATELQEGKTFLLSGDLEEGTITLRLSP